MSVDQLTGCLRAKYLASHAHHPRAQGPATQ
jgi:hypothetical protein